MLETALKSQDYAFSNYLLAYALKFFLFSFFFNFLKLSISTLELVLLSRHIGVRSRGWHPGSGCS